MALVGSYGCGLTNCFQKVDIHGFSSSLLLVLSGMPHGSVLRPLLYTNDIAGVSQDCKFILFANDTKSFRAVKSPSNVILLQSSVDYGLGEHLENEVQCIKVKVHFATRSHNNNGVYHLSSELSVQTYQ